MLRKLILILFVLSKSLLAFDGFYLGAQVGQVGLLGKNFTNKHDNALGFGLDLGARANPLLDVVLQLQRSSHSGFGDLTLTSTSLSADFHFYAFNDIEFTLGAGPGFYFFKNTAGTESDFGLHVGSNIDALIDDRFRLGVGFRLHNVFSGNTGGNYWTALMRLGYHFVTN